MNVIAYSTTSGNICIVSRRLSRLNLFQPPMTVSNLNSWWLPGEVQPKHCTRCFKWGKIGLYAIRTSKKLYQQETKIKKSLQTESWGKTLLSLFYCLSEILEHKHRDVLWSLRPSMFHRACYPLGRRKEYTTKSLKIFMRLCGRLQSTMFWRVMVALETSQGLLYKKMGINYTKEWWLNVSTFHLERTGLVLKVLLSTELLLEVCQSSQPMLLSLYRTLLFSKHF